MALATTINGRFPIGNKIMKIGTGVLSGTASTGDVATGMTLVEQFHMNIQGSAAKACSVNETLPLSGGDVTVVTEDNDLTFYWTAIGQD